MTATIDRPLAVDTAARIARALCDSAFEHDGRFAWIGTTQLVDEDGTPFETVVATLGPDLYGGDSGVALFLAEAGRLTGDARSTAVARGAMRRALSHADRVPTTARWSFYEGWIGIAYAAVRVGAITGDAELVAGADALIQRLGSQPPDDVPLDVLSGAAGAAPALLRLAADLDQPGLVDVAARLGQAIVRGAHRDANGWSWRFGDATDEASPRLTGFSHGAAGMGWTLLELHHGTGDAVFAEGAREAFRYERGLFRAGEDNWPDLREADDVESAPSMVAWCHGATGIGLSRLRAMRLTDDAELGREVAAAVRCTTARLTRDGDAPARDYTPCHGRLGLVELLLDDPTARDTALASAAQAARRYGRSPNDWPCGLTEGTNPSLMTGLAGIGYTYLRIADATVPSLLVLAVH